MIFGEKWSSFEYIFKMRPERFAHGLDIGCERKRRNKDDAEFFGRCA